MSNETSTLRSQFPSRIQSYRILRVLGSGAAGVVYEGIDPQGTVVALKVIKNRGRAAPSLAEPSLLSVLDHPNIVGLRDYFLHGNDVVLVLEHVDGPNLGEYLQRQGGRLSVQQTHRLLAQMSSALAHAHDHLILHRDIKPANILVREGPNGVQFLLTDFGVGRVATAPGMRGQVVGTYAFMAPEQIRGRPATESDLWALGVVAYQCLCGHRPFEGGSLDELSHSIMFETPKLPSARVGIPESRTEYLVMQLLERRPHARGTAARLYAALVPATAHIARSGTTAQKLDPTWEAQATRHIRRNLWWMGALILVVSLPTVIPSVVVVLGAVVLYRGYDRESDLGVGSGFALMIAGNVLDFAIASALWTEGESSAVLIARGLFGLPMVWIFGRLVVETTRLGRDLATSRALRFATGDEDSTFEAMQDYVDRNPGDCEFHQRHVEALLSRGRHQEAIVEARLILDHDPYNLAASLALAHGYALMGMVDQCREVCQFYLAVAGHCFEFRQLLEWAEVRT